MESEKKNLLKIYFRWPFDLGIFLVLLSVGVLCFNTQAGLFLLVITAVYFLTAFIIYLIYKKSLLNRMIEFGSSYAQVQNQLLRGTGIPFAICGGNGEIFWCNPAFSKCSGLRKKQGLLSNLFPEMENADMDMVTEYHVCFGDRRYRLNTARLNTEDLQKFGEPKELTKNILYSLYLVDETDLLYYKQTLSEEKAVLALIYLDNYEEVMSKIEDVRRSLLSALLERKINKYVSSVKGVVRKLEKDRYLLIMKQKSLWEMEETKFSLLEDIKTVNIGNDMAVTISMGIGLSGSSYEENYEYARAAIDMALGRGGDQAVVKDGAQVHYFGGKAQSTERTTRVKARIKAHALRELIDSKDDVMIMGHPIGDLDCLGAAMGIYRAAKFSGKRVHIVIGDLSSSMRPLMSRLRENAEYEDDLFVSRQRALELFHKDTLLVVVDTNRPSYTECPDLLKRAQSVVVMDHHRQGRETIENALLSYVEPYASSASEMVAEVIQYYDDDLRVKPVEADAIYAGIVMDTNNFADKAGVRTFEAAAYLRRCGADVSRVRKLFREPMEDCRLKAETVHSAEVYKDAYMIGVCPSRGDNRNQTVIAAQAANDLLEIRDIRASFVFTEYEGKVFLSARSIDEVNVQVMMEKLGGGGHMSVAGAQFTGITVEEAKARLKAVIDEN